VQLRDGTGPSKPQLSRQPCVVNIISPSVLLQSLTLMHSSQNIGQRTALHGNTVSTALRYSAWTLAYCLRTFQVFLAVCKSTVSSWQRTAVRVLHVVETQRRLPFLDNGIWLLLLSRPAIAVIICWRPVSQWHWSITHCSAPYNLHYGMLTIANTVWHNSLQLWPITHRHTAA